MAITYPTFAELNATRLAALRELLSSVIVDYNPTIDLRRGVVGDLVLQPRALLTAATEQAVLNALLATSLSAIIANPAIADQAAVDRVLGNFQVVRRPAVAATGSIAIVLSRLAVTLIAAGSVFTIGTQTFSANKTYTGRTSSGDVVLDTDRLITAVSGGNYIFTIDVTAVTAGVASNSVRGASAVPAILPFAFVRAYADTSLSGGVDAESNSSVLGRLASGMAVKAWSNRPSIEAASRGRVPALQNISVVGHGDPEMLRANHSLWPVAGGGRADLYARTALLYSTIRIRKTATLISAVGPVGTWQFGLTKADAPGFYEVASVTLPSGDPSAVSFTIASDTRSLDLTGTDRLPDVANTTEGAYSAYQAGTFQFVDTTTNATSLTPNVSQAVYDVLVRVMPDVLTLQTFWSTTANAPTTGDVLVKAVVPCFVTVSFTINVPTGTVVNTTTLASQLSTAVNQLRFPGVLSLSYINQLLHNLVPAATSVTSYNVTGRIRESSGNQIYLAGSGDLTIPHSPNTMTTANTAEFFLMPEDVTITVVTS